MEARLHYSRPLLLLQPQGAASPAPAPAMPGAVPDALSVPAPADALAFLDGNAILILALLVCGLVAALALHVVLQCALRVVTLRACHFAGADTDGAAPQDDPEHSTGEGGAGQAAGTGTHGRKQRQPRRITKLVQALPCLAYSSALELAGSSRSECPICLAAFARGEAVRVLPRCSHGFHARCIDRWLAARPTCPTCRQAPFVETTALLQPDSSSGPVAAVPLVRVVIVGDGVARLVEPDAELVRGPYIVFAHV